MAEVVDGLPNIRRLGRPPFYPWDEWLDGRVWKLRRGEDFGATARSFYTYTRKHARDLGLKVELRVDGDDLYIRALR